MTRVTVLATSDLHAHWEGPNRGIARIESLLARRDAESTVLVDNGDLLTGSQLGSMLADRWGAMSGIPHPVLAELERIGYDAWVPGNHDFDHGIDWLLGAVRGLSSLMTICANVVDASTGERLFPASHVVERGGQRIGLVGAVTGHVQRLGRYDAVSRVRFTDPVAAVTREVDRLRGDCDYIVVAYHGGFVVDPATKSPMHYSTGEDEASRMLEIAGIHGLVAGHQHWQRSGVTPGGVAYVQPGYAGVVIGELSFVANEGATPAAASSVTARARLIETAGEQPAPGPLDDKQAQLPAWLAEVSTLSDDELHRVVAARLDGSTALALPAPPRSRSDLAAAFPGIYGVSRVRLPESEYREAIRTARESGVQVSERGVVARAGHVETLVNAPLREFMPEGRVQLDSVIDWLDELVYAQRQCVLSGSVHADDSAVTPAGDFNE